MVAARKRQELGVEIFQSNLNFPVIYELRAPCAAKLGVIRLDVCNNGVGVIIFASYKTNEGTSGRSGLRVILGDA